MMELPCSTLGAHVIVILLARIQKIFIETNAT